LYVHNVYYSTNSTIKHPDVRGKKAFVNKFKVPMLMTEDINVTFESHNSESICNENEFHYSVLKSFCYQQLNFRIKNMMLLLKKSI